MDTVLEEGLEKNSKDYELSHDEILKSINPILNKILLSERFHLKDEFLIRKLIKQVVNKGYRRCILFTFSESTEPYTHTSCDIEHHFSEERKAWLWHFKFKEVFDARNADAFTYYLSRLKKTISKVAENPQRFIKGRWRAVERIDQVRSHIAASLEGKINAFICDTPINCSVEEIDKAIQEWANICKNWDVPDFEDTYPGEWYPKL